MTARVLPFRRRPPRRAVKIQTDTTPRGLSIKVSLDPTRLRPRKKDP